MIELEFICDACTTPIAGDDGVIRVSLADIRDARRQLGERGESTPASLSVRDLATLPPTVRWHILHLVCRPQDGDAYEIDVDLARTPADLDRWSRHLRAKNWLQLTDWDELVGSVSARDGGRILVKQPRGGAV